MPQPTENPYAPPNQDSLETGAIDRRQYDDSTRYEFEAVVERSDLKGRRGNGVSVFLLLNVGVLLALALVDSSLSLFLPMTLLVVAGVLLLIMRLSPRGRSGDTAWLGSISGFVSEHRIVFHQEHRTSNMLLSGLTGCEFGRDSIVLSFSSHRRLFTVLPKRAFRETEFEVVSQMLKNRFSDLPKVAISTVDDRFLEEPNFPTESPPEDSVPFSGEVRMRDGQGTALQGSIRKMIFSLIIIYVIVVGLPFGGLWLITESVLFSTVPGVFLFCFLLWKSIPNLLKTTRGDTVVYNMRGWVHASGVQTVVAIGATNYQWSAFSGCETNSTCVLLRIDGAKGMFVFLSRSQFENESAWNSATGLCIENVGGIQTS